MTAIPTKPSPGSLAWDVPCTWCRANEDQPCRTPAGRLRPAGQEHAERWAAVRAEYSRPRRYILKDDDRDFAMLAGDVLVCQPYRYDPGKLTVLYREGDGFDPACNVYRSQISPVRGLAGRVDRLGALA